jgi:putrescine aminotransferase
MAAVGVHERVASVLRDKGGEVAHGYTYSGHPVTAAVALANLRLIEEEKLVERVRDDIGPYLQGRFATLRDHPLVGESRGVGLLAGVEIVKDKTTRETWGADVRPAMRLRALCFEHGVVMRAARDCVYCSPPFVITRAQVDELVETLRRCLDLAAAELGVKA